MIEVGQFWVDVTTSRFENSLNYKIDQDRRFCYVWWQPRNIREDPSHQKAHDTINGIINGYYVFLEPNRDSRLLSLGVQAMVIKPKELIEQLLKDLPLTRVPYEEQLPTRQRRVNG